MFIHFTVEIVTRLKKGIALDSFGRLHNIITLSISKKFLISKLLGSKGFE